MILVCSKLIQMVCRDLKVHNRIYWLWFLNKYVKKYSEVIKGSKQQEPKCLKQFESHWPRARLALTLWCDEPHTALTQRLQLIIIHIIRSGPKVLPSFSQLTTFNLLFHDKIFPFEAVYSGHQKLWLADFSERGLGLAWRSIHLQFSGLICPLFAVTH